MDRTLRASLLAAFITFAFLAGIGIFMQFEVTASLIVGAVAGVLAGLLIWLAARRAASFHEPPRPPIEPGFPGPPERPDGTTPDGTDPGTHPDAPDTPSDEGDDR